MQGKDAVCYVLPSTLFSDEQIQSSNDRIKPPRLENIFYLIHNQEFDLNL